MNKYKNIEIVSFDDITDVYDVIDVELTQLEVEDDYIAVYGKSDLIKELFTTMISNGYEFGYADFDALDELQKDMIYMIFIRGNCIISVEPSYSKNGIVIGHDAKVALFYMDDCKQNVIDYCVNHDMKVTLFDFEGSDCDECEESDEGKFIVNGKTVTKEEFDKYVNTYIKNDSNKKYCDECECSFNEDENDDIHGFTARRSDENGYMSYSLYTSENLSRKDINDFLKLFGLKMN